MRYDDWDVILLPTGGKETPLKEFKTNCHVVVDKELGSHPSLGLPLVTCFVPGLPNGSSFQVSIHNWSSPTISHYTRASSRQAELVVFEARVFIDGVMVASTSFAQNCQWPEVITASFDVTSHGDIEPLRFPDFRQELLYQSKWFPDDDTGRIKVVITEAFRRSSTSTPLQRVKNVVAFAFQHAPLNILESNGIAWPNPKMWQRLQTALYAPMPVAHPHHGADIQAAAARRSAVSLPGSHTSPAGGQHIFAHDITKHSPAPPAVSTSNSNQPWTLGGLLGQPMWAGFSSAEVDTQRRTDTNMVDATANTMTDVSGAPEPMHISGPSLEDDDDNAEPVAPTNTPIAGGELDRGKSGTNGHVTELDNCLIPQDLAHELTQSLLNQPPPVPAHLHQTALPAAEVRSRKEQAADTASVWSQPFTFGFNAAPHHRKVSQSGIKSHGPQDGRSTSPHHIGGSPILPPNTDFGRDMTNSGTSTQHIEDNGKAKLPGWNGDNGQATPINIDSQEDSFAAFIMQGTS